MSELINTETGEVIAVMTASEASNITEQIAHDLGDIADTYEQVMPLIREALTRRAFAALGYRSPGEYIAEEFGGALERLGIEARRGVVRELSAAGMSTRAIAPVVGTGQSTVSDDLRLGDRDRSPERAETDHSNVVGIDGKTYRRPAPRQESDEERATREIDQGRRNTCTRIAECVRFLDGGGEYAEIFLRGSYPYEAEYLAPGMRLSRSRIDSCIEFLTAVREGVLRD